MPRPTLPALLCLLTALASPAVRADGVDAAAREPPPPTCASTEAMAPGDTDEPEACSTCGVGAVALLLVGSAPITTLSALALLAATQAGVLRQDPLASFGIPLWGAALGCAGAHTFLALMSSLAFGRDVMRLCGSFVDEDRPTGPTTRPACEPVPGPLEVEAHEASIAY